MVGLPNRNERSRASEPSGDGGPEEAAGFIAEHVADLRDLAHRHGFETLGFLLDMALMEADECVRTRNLRDLL